MGVAGRIIGGVARVGERRSPGEGAHEVELVGDGDEEAFVEVLVAEDVVKGGLNTHRSFLRLRGSQTLYEGMLDLSHMRPAGNAWLATVLDGKEINR